MNVSKQEAVLCLAGDPRRLLDRRRSRLQGDELRRILSPIHIADADATQLSS